MARRNGAKPGMCAVDCALRQSEERFRLLVECAAPYAIFMLDPEGTVVTWNEGAERGKGYKAEEVLGRNFSMFFTPEDAAAGQPAQELTAAARDGCYATEAWRRREDGSLFWALVTLTAIRGADGKLRGFAKVTRDMTRQKRMEESLAQLTADLESRVAERTRQLESTVEELRRKNAEVETIARIVSRDLEEKEVLLREIHHRVKNNLQVVQSLLKMRARALPAGEARTAIETTGQRVHAMAMVHERLYLMPDLAALPVASHLRDVFGGAVACGSVQPDQIQLIVDAEEILLTLERAIPFGLLANELLSNCLKHGFPNGRRGTVKVSMHRIAGAVRMIVEDDGVGLPQCFAAEACSSMGLKLAASLAHQLGGKLEFATGRGCRVQADLTRI